MGYLDFISGIFIGNVSAIVSLVLFNYVLSPKVTFSNDIRCINFKKENWKRYSIKVKKKGFVDLIDTKISCRIEIADIGKNGGKLLNFYDIPATLSRSLLVSRGTRIVHLKLIEAIDFSDNRDVNFQRHVKKRIPEKGLRFEDIFMAYPDVKIIVHIIGHDRFTGVKKLYVSPRYSFHSLVYGKWRGMIVE
ncbi:hypothetical protein [Sneathiella sp.]|uniref:hypothetical protein n=1 Tax=Sneathiella sp. TaxID=1964365 RepID=UPI002617C72B|nr:hypothetical protein [Sneathiella sp.]MDF2367229.1 hypothetical protein [Sneathiella sp.]